jgi:hypothetical protein
VVVYYPSADGLLHIEAGVEIHTDFRPTEDVHAARTPAGRVATVTHWGAYDQMQPAHSALDAWCAAHGEPRGQVRREVYGDWSADPNQLRTDIYYKPSGP